MKRVIWVVSLSFAIFSCQSRNGTESNESDTLDVGPHRQCTWVYSEAGLVSFKNGLTHPGFDPKDNPAIHISRRGLTARIVGTLSDEFMAKHNNSINEVVKKFPYLTPVKQTSIHEVVPESGADSPAKRNANPKGQIVKTSIKNTPPNTVMIVYPASIAAVGFNTLAGNHVIDGKTREKPNNEIGSFAKFPFISYSAGTGHAMHGPITGEDNMWHLKRGRVSHGCNRMQGEHIVEVSVLLGCGKDPSIKRCPDPTAGPQDNEKVTVMEEFDFVPKPELADKLPEGEYKGTWMEVLENFVGVDTEFDRLDPPSQIAKLGGQSGFFLEKVLTTRTPRDTNPLTKPFVHRREFKTWDNRDFKFVTGKQCN